MGRRLAPGILLALLTAVVCCGNPQSIASAQTTPTVSPPQDLKVSSAGIPSVALGQWISSRHVSFSFRVETSGQAVTPQIELGRAKIPLTGQPTISGAPVAVSGVVTLASPFLRNGRYHWAARVTSSGGSSSWVTMGSSGMDFGTDTQPPLAPMITSPTNPKQNRPYNKSHVVLDWSSHDKPSGIAGFSYAVDRKPIVPTGTGSPIASASTAPGNGVWYDSVRAEDRAGNWSPVSTYRFRIDTHVPRVVWIGSYSRSFNPVSGSMSVRFKVDKSASTSVFVYRVGSKYPVAAVDFTHLRKNVEKTVVWSGKTSSGANDPPGRYFFVAHAVDRAGNEVRSRFGLFTISHPVADPALPAGLSTSLAGKRIVITLSRQTLDAFQGPRLALHTFVTTGNPSLPTPVGSYSILTKQSPFEFISPWPVGSPYWYPPSWSHQAMLFRSGGYFIHDAPWRSAFGPGTDGQGQPGTNYGGTHGCVNVPPGAMEALWNWTPIGTPVYVVP
jgi:lipoprotein-anchoring transpeptidase ErfK/SrfK